MIDIIIPFYKIEFFRECLESLADQTNKNFHIYIGDDASPEDPTSIIEEFNNHLNITYKRFDKNIGGTSLVKHWERCIALGKEDWLLILGDDDFLGKNVIESWYKNSSVFQEHTNIVRIATVSVDQDSKFISKKYQHPDWETAEDSFYRRFKQLTRSSLSEYIFKRSAYENFGFYDYPLGWYSDNRAWLDFSGNKKIYSINEALVYIRISDLSISGRIDNEELKAKAEIQFFDHLIKKRFNSFKKEESFNLLKYFEKLLRQRNEFSVVQFYKILFYHLKNYDKRELKYFFKRSVKQILLK